MLRGKILALNIYMINEERFKIHFLEIAYASLMEVYCQLQIAVDLSYITPDDLQIVKRKIFTTSKLISGLRTSKVAQLNG